MCIIECKDWGKKIGIEVVRDLLGKIEDVGAMKGVIVSAKGFTKNAKQFASHNSINLYRLIDAESLKWSEESLIPIQLTQIYLKYASVEMYDAKTNEPISLVDAYGNIAETDNMHLLDIKKNRYLKLKEFLEDKWDELFEVNEPKDNDTFETEKDRYSLLAGENKHHPVVVKFKLISESIYYYGHLSLAKCQGLIDQETDELLTDSFVTKPFLFKDVIKTWPSTKNKEKIPFRAMHYFWIGHFFSKREQMAPEGVIIQKNYNQKG